MPKKGSSRSIKKIWIAVSTPFQINFFYPLIEKLREEFEFIITARDHDRIFSMLDAKGLNFIPVGIHGGASLDGKLEAYAKTVQNLIPIIKEEKPDLLLTERWPEAVRVAFGFNIPAWTLYYDEREKHVNRMVFPLSSKVFTPSFYSRAEIEKSGVNPENIIWFNGFHTCYLKGHPPSTFRNNPFRKLGINSPVVLIRPEPSFATFFPQKKNILEDTISILSNNGNFSKNFNLVIFPRTKEQAINYAKYPVNIIVDSFPDNPVAYADVTVGAAETMLMEAFVLGKPAISTVYWKESLPLIELHKHIPHIVNPKEVAVTAIDFLDPHKQQEFNEMSKIVVDSMEDPVQKIVEEIYKFCGKSEPFCEGSSKRRGKIEIYSGILELIAFKEVKLTHIMQRANLSYSMVRKSVDWLYKKKLIERRSDHVEGVYYRATVEGLAVLAECKKVIDKLL